MSRAALRFVFALGCLACVVSLAGSVHVQEPYKALLPAGGFVFLLLRLTERDEDDVIFFQPHKRGLSGGSTRLFVRCNNCGLKRAVVDQQEKNLPTGWVPYKKPEQKARRHRCPDCKTETNP